MHRTRLMLLVAFVAASGCSWHGQHSSPFHGNYNSALDDHYTGFYAHRLARRALKDYDGVSRDFRHGFRQAMEDLAQGHDGTLPPVPPETYWYIDRRANTGQQRVNDWYMGYSEGVSAAAMLMDPTVNQVTGASGWGL